jgi:hypothetical protein
MLLIPTSARPVHAQEGVEVAEALTPIVFGAALAKEDAKQAADGEQTLKTLPIGAQVYKTLVEVEDLDQLKPNAEVDVYLVTLTGEGAHKEDILRGLKIYSIAKPRNTEALEPKAPEAEGEAGADAAAAKSALPVRALPVRIVGLIVNGSQLQTLRLADAQGVIRLQPAENEFAGGPFSQIMHNFVTNLFQPLLLFFFMGFAIPLLKVPFDFPKALYQSLSLYLLVAIGWHGGELMAHQSSSELAIAGGLCIIGFVTNGIIGTIATWILRAFTPMRRIDAITVGAYYGSDSAGTFVTCLGILAALNILHDSYMPVLLAVMEIPGCLVGLFLVSKLRRRGMDALGNMPDEPGYDPTTSAAYTSHAADDDDHETHGAHGTQHGAKLPAKVHAKSAGAAAHPMEAGGGLIDWKILHEVFFNPGLYFLFAGILVGFISGRQALSDPHVVEGPNHLFVFLFKGALCLFLLEMGITACRRLSDLKTAGWQFIVFGILGPCLFATIGMVVLHAYALVLGHHFQLGTYTLFAVLCGASSYIAVPAVQRLAIPEASPTLPLAASLGLTFSWNVTMGIPIYLEIAKQITNLVPVA